MWYDEKYFIPQLYLSAIDYDEKTVDLNDILDDIDIEKAKEINSTVKLVIIKNSINFNIYVL